MVQFSTAQTRRSGRPRGTFSLRLLHLTIIDSTIKLIQAQRGIDIQLNHIPLDDPSVYELLSTGFTTDLFQLESAGMKRYVKELKPSSLGDISAMIALYRPGPMEHIDRLIRSKHGLEQVTYPHPSMKELLDETYGVIVYQDQVLKILQNFAGYSLGDADTVRKAMGKKIPALMAEERSRFVSGAVDKGYTEQMGSEIFNLIEPFAGYAFNKAHSVSYALISYWTAYFKTHHPLEFMSSVLNCRLDQPDRYIDSISECTRMGITIALPDVNRSHVQCTTDDSASHTTGPGQLRIGLAAVKSVGEAAVRPLVEERLANGPYTSLADFCGRADVSHLSRRTLEALVRAGAFDSLGTGASIIEALDDFWATAQQETHSRNTGQIGMFGLLDSDTTAAESSGIYLTVDTDGPDLTDQEKAEMERDTLGMAISYNPVLALATIDAGNCINSTLSLEQATVGSTLSVIGYVNNVTERRTRDARRFLQVHLSLIGGTLEMVVWPEVLEKTGDLWRTGIMVQATGKYQLRGDSHALNCSDANEFVIPSQTQATPPTTPIEPRPTSYPSSELSQHPAGLLIKMTETADAVDDAWRMRQAIRIMLEYHGDSTVYTELHLLNGERILLEIPTVTAQECPELQQRIEEILGSEAVTLGYVPLT